MNKKIKLITISILSVFVLFFVIFISVDFFAYKVLCPKQDNTAKSGQFYLLKEPFNFKVWKKQRFRGHSSVKLRPAFGIEYKNPGVILLGCEYMYGEKLNPEQTLGAKLSELIKSPVYNLSIPGGGPQHALFQVESHDYDKEIKNSKYAIFLVTGEHRWRVKAHSNGYFNEKYIWPSFDIQNENLVYNTDKFFLTRTYIYQYLNKLYWMKFAPFDLYFDIVAMHFIKLNHDLKEINPDIVLVLILFCDNNNNLDFLTSERWYELKEEGIKVIDADELSSKENIIITDQKYRIEGDGHPSEEVWEILAREIKKELNL